MTEMALQSQQEQNFTPLNFEGNNVRIIRSNSEIWFVARDVCSCLGIGNISQALTRLDDDETTIILNDSGVGGSKLSIVNESGLYSLVLTSRKPEAKRFKKRVTSEILPSIRKTGSYGVPSVPQDYSSALRLAADEHDKRLVLEAEKKQIEAELQEVLPKAEALDRLSAREGSMCLTDAAKTLKVKAPRKIFPYLRLKGWIYQRPPSTDWIGYQDKIKTGYLEHREQRFTGRYGEERIKSQVVITAKGLAKLSELLEKEPI